MNTETKKPKKSSKPAEGYERFQIDVPPELAKRVKKFMEEEYFNKTTFTLQAFDAFITRDKESG